MPQKCCVRYFGFDFHNKRKLVKTQKVILIRVSFILSLNLKLHLSSNQYPLYKSLYKGYYIIRVHNYQKDGSNSHSDMTKDTIEAIYLASILIKISLFVFEAAIDELVNTIEDNVTFQSTMHFKQCPKLLNEVKLI